MSFSDPIADMLTRIRNAHAVGHRIVSVSRSLFKEEIVKALLREGYIRGYVHKDGELRIELKYFNGAPVIRHVKRVSKPSLRVYTKIGRLAPVANGLGNAFLSTPQGVLSDTEARRQGVGGEVLCVVS